MMPADNATRALLIVSGGDDKKKLLITLMKFKKYSKKD